MPGDTEYRTIGIIGVANISLLAVFTFIRTARFLYQQRKGSMKTPSFLKKLFFHVMLLTASTVELPLYIGFLMDGRYTLVSYSFHKLESAALFTAFSITINDWAGVLYDIQEYELYPFILRKATLVTITFLYVLVSVMNFIFCYTLGDFNSYTNSMEYQVGLFFQIAVSVALTFFMLSSGLKLAWRIRGAAGGPDTSQYIQSTRVNTTNTNNAATGGAGAVGGRRTAPVGARTRGGGTDTIAEVSTTDDEEELEEEEDEENGGTGAAHYGANKGVFERTKEEEIASVSTIDRSRGTESRESNALIQAQHSARATALMNDNRNDAPVGTAAVNMMTAVDETQRTTGDCESEDRCIADPVATMRSSTTTNNSTSNSTVINSGAMDGDPSCPGVVRIPGSLSPTETGTGATGNDRSSGGGGGVGGRDRVGSATRGGGRSVSRDRGYRDGVNMNRNRNRSSAGLPHHVVDGQTEFRNALWNLNAVMATCSACIFLQAIMLSLDYGLGYANSTTKTVGPTLFYWACYSWIPLWGVVLALLYLSRTHSKRQMTKSHSSYVLSAGGGSSHYRSPLLSRGDRIDDDDDDDEGGGGEGDGEGDTEAGASNRSMHGGSSRGRSTLQSHFTHMTGSFDSSGAGSLDSPKPGGIDGAISGGGGRGGCGGGGSSSGMLSNAHSKDNFSAGYLSNLSRNSDQLFEGIYSPDDSVNMQFRETTGSTLPSEIYYRDVRSAHAHQGLLSNDFSISDVPH